MQLTTYLELIKMKFNSTGTVCSSHTAIESVRELHSNAILLYSISVTIPIQPGISKRKVGTYAEAGLHNIKIGIGYST